MTRRLIGFVSFAAIALALGITVAGPGTRYGLWDYGAGLNLIRQLALPTMIAAGLSALAFLFAILRARPLAWAPLLATFAAAAAASAPLQMKAKAEANPFIHDITTDFENPPAILAAAELPRKNPPEYVGAEPAPRSEPQVSTADAQRQAFPDITPLELPISVGDATTKAKAALAQMKMEVLAEGPDGDQAGAGWRIEAVSTSKWFGFKDDFIVRLTPTETGVRVDVRSKSRVGMSDLGANAERVRAFLTLMKA
jgi:uncharacterized protein (DUF1499 family)